ncbi:MAG TPA: SDR family oxidoreductase, partial [Dehalococcoidia bacterium]|nr:SDR family oxidoreductase [Dehalococcoidia bacterium]
IALALAEAGADVVITDVAPVGTRNIRETGEEEEKAGWKGIESLVAEIEQIGRRVLPLIGNVSVKADAERMVKQTIDHFGKVDILVNNAGAPHGEDRNWFWEVPEEAYDKVLAVNPKGNYLMSVPVIKHLLERGEGGRIIHIASVAGKVGMPKRAVYNASKFAVIGLTQAMAQELAPYKITVNAVCPGATDTARNASSRAREAAAPDAASGRSQQIIGAAPVGRIGTAADIARMVVFLCEPASDYITGQSINVDGGLVMH